MRDVYTMRTNTTQKLPYRNYSSRNYWVFRNLFPFLTEKQFFLFSKIFKCSNRRGQKVVVHTDKHRIGQENLTYRHPSKKRDV